MSFETILRHTKVGGNISGAHGVSIDDVYLYPTGMSAVWHSHRLLASTLGSRIGFENLKTAHIKSVTFVFINEIHIDTPSLLFVDSYKFLESTPPGYQFFTNDDLEPLLTEGTPDRPAILGLFIDFPGDSHLLSADLPRLRSLADPYNFPLIIDETVASHLNVQVLPFVDIVICSLTKAFSGMANVVGDELPL